MRHFQIPMSGMLFLGMLMSALLGGCNGKNTSEEPTPDTFLVVEIPAVERFVVISVDFATIYKEASTSSPKRVMWMENIESDMADFQVQWADTKVPRGYLSDPYTAFAGEVLAVLGEEDDFYRVNINAPYSAITVGYVPKKDVRVVTPKPLTPEVIESEEWACVHVVREGRFKNLVFRSVMEEMEGEKLEIGLLQDGVVAYPASYTHAIERNDRLSALEFMAADDPNNWGNIFFRYPASMTYTDSEGSEWGLDTKKLTVPQMDSIMQAIGRPESDFMRCQYYFPTLEGKFRDVYWSIPSKAE